MLEHDLEALRCPDATIQMRKVIECFVGGASEALTLKTIEPSLIRSLEAFNVEKEYGLIIETSSVNITEAQRSTWAEDYYEEDYSDVDKVTVLSIFKVCNKN